MLLVNIPIRSFNLSAKLRLPMIKFRHGADRGQHQAPAASRSPAAPPSKGQAATATQSGAIFDFQIPQRFKRKPLSDEEIEYINRGGPA